MFFGDLGDSSAKLIAYIESVPGVMLARSNAASWMLDVVSSAASPAGVDFQEFYKSSPLYHANTVQVVALCHPDGGQPSDDAGDDAYAPYTTFPVSVSDRVGVAALNVRARAQQRPLERIVP